MIKLQVIGNLGKDCTVKEVNGKNVINFSVAHTERYKDNQGNQKEKTTWVECAYWTDKTAVAQYLTKGKTVYAEGAPEADAYMNKDNQPASTLRMRVLSVQLLGGNNPDGQPASPASNNYAENTQSSTSTATATAGNATSGADDLPF